MTEREPLLNTVERTVIRTTDAIDSRTESYQELLKSALEGRFNLLCLILLFQSAEVLAILMSTSLFTLVSLVFGALLVGLFWVAIVSAVIIGACVLIIHKNRETFKTSNRIYGLSIVVTICQGMFISYFGLLYNSTIIFYEGFFVLLALLGVTAYASRSGEDFDSKKAVFLAVGIAAVAYLVVAISKMSTFSLILVSFR